MQSNVCENIDIEENTFIGIRRLILTEFRNHARLEIDTQSKVIVLFGPNGAGKTNILEAISLLGAGRGLRSADISELSRNCEDGGSFAVSALMGHGIDERRIGIGLDINAPSMRKIARLNGKDISSKALGDSLRLIWLTPQMDRLFAGPNSDRRKFLDRLTLSFFPECSSSFSDYEKLLRERQKILDSEYNDPIWLSTIEEQLAIHSASMAIARVEAISALQGEIYSRENSAFPKAELILDGYGENAHAQGVKTRDLEIEIAKIFKDNRAIDKATGRSLKGAHKTQFSARHLGNGMLAEKCSTGEQKALIIGLILAQAKMVSQGLQSNSISYFNRPNPVILLDEAFAHLDELRRNALAHELVSLRAQSWLTGTDKNMFESLGEFAEFYAISPNQAKGKQATLEQ